MLLSFSALFCDCCSDPRGGGGSQHHPFLSFSFLGLLHRGCSSSVAPTWGRWGVTRAFLPLLFFLLGPPAAHGVRKSFVFFLLAAPPVSVWRDLCEDGLCRALTAASGETFALSVVSTALEDRAGLSRRLGAPCGRRESLAGGAWCQSPVAPPRRTPRLRLPAGRAGEFETWLDDFTPAGSSRFASRGTGCKGVIPAAARLSRARCLASARTHTVLLSRRTAVHGFS